MERCNLLELCLLRQLVRRSRTEMHCELGRLRLDPDVLDTRTTDPTASTSTSTTTLQDWLHFEPARDLLPTLEQGRVGRATFLTSRT